MSTAMAAAPVAPLPTLDRNPSPRNYPTLAAAPSVERYAETGPSPDYAPRSYERTPPDTGKTSPRSLRSGGNNPKIIVKKEPPSSPSMQPGRHRPKKLDLNTNTSSFHGPNTSRPSAAPLTARDSLGTMQDVGLACLSPGLMTHDPTMREQLQRSISVREQQRIIIEQRLLKSAKGDGAEVSRSDSLNSASKAPVTGGSKKRPPPGLSIVPPAAERFANERIVQSAPLNQTFTGRNDPPPHRQGEHNPYAQNSHAQHVPAIQTTNRLPPISDVFGANELHPTSNRPPFLHTNSTPSHMHGPPMPSPSYPPQTAHPMSQPARTSFGGERPREYRSAEEAVQDLTGGREDLMPKIVHYGGHQPPTPPSPHPNQHENLTPHKYQQPGFGAGRRRSRNEYEAGSSPPLGTGRGDRPYGPFGEGRDSPATQRAKKEEFLSLCSRAWDLFHN